MRLTANEVWCVCYRVTERDGKRAQIVAFADCSLPIPAYRVKKHAEEVARQIAHEMHPLKVEVVKMNMVEILFHGKKPAEAMEREGR